MRPILPIAAISGLCAFTTACTTEGGYTLPVEPGPPPLVFNLEKVGPWTIGMPYDEFPPGVLQLQYSSESDDAATGTGCEMFGVPGMKGISLMFESGVLVRVDAHRLFEDEGEPNVTPIISPGLLFGIMPLEPFDEDVVGTKIAFGGELIETEHPYLGDAGSYLEYFPPDQPEYGLILETYGDEITSFRSGYEGQVRYIEGCL